MKKETYAQNFKGKLILPWFFKTLFSFLTS